jgi:hypothetical protein
MRLKLNQIYIGDALELMDELESSSVDLVFSSPRLVHRMAVAVAFVSVLSFQV